MFYELFVLKTLNHFSFHKCGNKNAKCFKKSIVKIPDEFITNGPKPTKIYEMGTIELLKLKSDSTRECD